MHPISWELMPVAALLCQERPPRSRPARFATKLKRLPLTSLECSEEDFEWEPGKFFVKGTPSKSKSIQHIAFAAYTNIPPGLEAGLEAVDYYYPPNLTFPFGTYICVVDIDKGTGEIKVRRFVAVYDCGNIINPMIVDGQIHGGLTERLAIAFMQLIVYDENGNVQGGSFMDYLLPTAVESPFTGRPTIRLPLRRITRLAPRSRRVPQCRISRCFRQRRCRRSFSLGRASYRHSYYSL